MSFLMIENNGVADVESFELLGASSARDDASQIGQFGSGAKHAILICLRRQMDIVITCGKTRIVPFTEPVMSNGQCAKRVCLRVGQKTIRTSMTLGFGELDWEQSIPMAMREFVSNALDQSDNDWQQIRVEFAKSPRAKEGTTRVFVEDSDDVVRYFEQIDKAFLHVTGKQDMRLIPKQGTPTKLSFYRQGVFVRHIDSASMYDYNADASCSIDESRNMDSYRVQSKCARLLSNGDHQTELRQVLRRLSNGNADGFYESGFSYYSLNDEHCRQAFHDEFGADATVTTEPIVAQKVRDKGHVAIVLPSGYRQAIVGCGTQDSIELLSAAEKRTGIEETSLTDECIATVREVWSALELASMTQGKPFPQLHQFFSTMEDGATIYGFWDSTTDDVWIHDERTTDRKVILEELIHYVSEHHDETRDFQDFVLRFATRMIF